VEAVATGNEIALQLFGDSVCAEMNRGQCALQMMYADFLCFKNNRAVPSQSGRDQVFDYFMLRVDGDALAAGQFAKIDVVSSSVKSQLDSAMLQALPLQPFTHAEFMHQVNGAVFKHAGADSFFDVLAGMHFQDDRFNPSALQQ
jgi:hypothetical protein